MTAPNVTVIIPAHNEAPIIGNTLKRIGGYLGGKYDYDLILVADRCTDDTVPIAAGFAAASNEPVPLTIIENTGKRGGKGYAVKLGMVAAKGDYIFFTDADLSTPIEEIDAFVTRLAAGFDLAIASRYMPESRILKHTSLKRRLWSLLFRCIMRRSLCAGRFLDTQCGFKGFKREAGKKLATLSTIDGFAFDIELLRNALRDQMRIVEIPVHWSADTDNRSTVTFWNGPVRMLYDIMRMARAR
jgi:dolichyl-phosphate beta-glucosyltransferase